MTTPATQPTAAHGSRLLAPAKINLVLRVGPSDPATGYHPLATWMCAVGLYDTLRIDVAASGATERGSGVELRCDDPSLPRDRGNLVVRAAESLCQRAGVDASRVRLELEKRIPAAAGLGGGSSDAAATLVGLNRAMSLGRSRAELCAIAATLGADVPFFVETHGDAGGGSAWCSGRGEVVRITPAPAKARRAMLVLPRGIAMPTAAVYRRFDELRLGRPENLSQAPDVAVLATLGAREMLPLLRNDLEPAAFSLSSELADMRDAVERAVRRPVRMSGSGSALFTLFDGQDVDDLPAGRDAPVAPAKEEGQGIEGQGIEGDEDIAELAEAVAAAGKAVAPSAARVVVVAVAPIAAAHDASAPGAARQRGR